METMELGLLFLAAVLMSSILSQFSSKLPAPLIQIALGILISVLGAGYIEIKFDPELFLVLFVAPLLYNEACETDLGSLWRHKIPVVACAIGLVVFTMFCAGFSLCAIVPGASLSVCLALGAALGPTDAVTVSSLSGTAQVKTYIKNILKGESLLNDASGLVCFQFAVLAATTGSFSLLSAGWVFLLNFFGGLLLGFICGKVTNSILEKIRNSGYEDSTFSVLFEVFLPFMVYLIANRLGTSAIIAVVMCGIVNASSRRTSGVSLARTSIVSTSVWKIINFTLNGVVFVLLGTQLLGIFSVEWNSIGISNTFLVLLVVFITFIVVLSRFAWCLIMIYLEGSTGSKRLHKEVVKDALILALSGAKGAVNLSIILTLPFTYIALDGSLQSFPYRNLLIFLACGVIVCSLLIANYVVPLLVPKPKISRTEEEEKENNVLALLDILRGVIEELSARQTAENFSATRQVIEAYNNRIDRVKASHNIEQESCNKLRVQCLNWEEEFIARGVKEGVFDEEIADKYLVRVHRKKKILLRQNIILEAQWYIQKFFRTAVILFNHQLHRLPVVDPSQTALLRKALHRDANLYVVRKLEDIIANPSSETSTEDATTVLLEYQHSLRLLGQGVPSITSIARIDVKADEIERLALRLELAQIQRMQESGRISRRTADHMCENVFLMQIDLQDRV